MLSLGLLPMLSNVVMGSFYLFVFSCIASIFASVNWIFSVCICFLCIWFNLIFIGVTLIKILKNFNDYETIILSYDLSIRFLKIFCFSFFHAFSFSSCRLSCCFFPFASAMLILIKLFLMKSLHGTMVNPFCCTAPMSLLISLLVSKSFLVLVGSALQ